MREMKIDQKQPLVSIGMPVYNGGKTIRRAFDSLVKQSYREIEMIVIDDSSSDDTARICEEYAGNFSFVRFIRNERNLGSYGNFLKTLRASNGKYFVWASQDDYWYPEFVSVLAEVMEKNPDAIASVGASRYLWEDTGEEIYTVRLLEPDSPQAQSFYENAVSLITKVGKTARPIKNNTFIHGLLRRSEFLASVEAFPGIFVNERQILCQLALAGRLYFVDRILFEKGVRRRPRREFFPDDPFNEKKYSRYHKIRSILDLCRSISSSKIIPFRRKMYLPGIIWQYFRWQVVMPFVWFVADWVRPFLPKAIYLALKKIQKVL